MQKIDELLKEYNLIFTGTKDRRDFCKINFNIDKEEVNYDNCISLFDLVSSFNKLYTMFKKEYEAIKRFNLGKETEVISFDKFTYDDAEYRILSLYIDEPNIIDEPETLLYLREFDEEIRPYITNNKNPFEKSYYYKELELDSKVVKQYLDLFEKYSLLLETYKYLKNARLFGDGTYAMFTIIDDHKSNILNGLKNFKICFGDNHFNVEHFLTLSINLGENFGIDYDNCSYKINKEEQSFTPEEYIEILKKTYINKKYTKERKKY